MSTVSLARGRGRGVSAITRFNRPEALSRPRSSGQSGLGVWSDSAVHFVEFFAPMERRVCLFKWNRSAVYRTFVYECSEF